MHRKPSAKTLRTPHFAQFLRVLSGENQRALFCYQNKELNILPAHEWESNLSSTAMLTGQA